MHSNQTRFFQNIPLCSEKYPDEPRRPWYKTMTLPPVRDWSEFSTFRKKRNLTSLLHEVSLKDITPPLDETPPSDRSFEDGERKNFGDKSLAFSAAGSVYGEARDFSFREINVMYTELHG